MLLSMTLLFFIREDHKGGRIRNGGLIVEDGRDNDGGDRRRKGAMPRGWFIRIESRRAGVACIPRRREREAFGTIESSVVL